MVRRTWTSIWAKGMARDLAAFRKATKPSKKRKQARKTAPAADRSAARAPALRALARRALARRAALTSRPGALGRFSAANKKQHGERWLAGVAVESAGTRRYMLYHPPQLQPGERLPMIVMLHGCGQDAEGFAASTRMNQIALREHVVVLYPEQDRLANPQGCWNWFDTKSGRAYREAELVMAVVEEACSLFPVDRGRVAVAGLSAGGSMAALLVTRYPEHFKAVVMHSGIPPGTADSVLTAMGAMQGRRATSPLDSSVSTTAAPLPPLLVIHGTDDAVVDVRNGRAAAQIWADAAGARAASGRGVQRGARYPMKLTDFKHNGNTAATLAEVQRLGHAWSGGAAKQPFGDAQGPDASRMVWAFAAKHFTEAAG